jgi:hypothetical protein
VGQTASQLGEYASLLVLPLFAVLTLNAGAGQLGVLRAVGQAPILLLSLFVGAWVDRWRTRTFVTAVLSGDVIPPSHVAHAPDDEMPFRARWALREDNSLICGEALATVLHDDAVPQMVHLLDRTNLLQECRHPSLPVVRMMSLTKAEIFLRVDDAPSEEIESLLADVRPAGPGDNFIAWTRQRLAQRQTAASS